MSIENPKQLGLITVILTFGGFCWLLSLVSFLATQNWMWQLLNHFQSGMQSCGLIKSHAGCPCPLCGMSRAFRSLWQGHIDQALAFNSNSLLLFLLMLGGCILSAMVAHYLCVKSRGPILPMMKKPVQSSLKTA